jgi:hypothetical protein
MLDFCCSHCVLISSYFISKMFHKFSCVPPKEKKLEPLGAKGACCLTSFLQKLFLFTYVLCHFWPRLVVWARSMGVYYNGVKKVTFSMNHGFLGSWSNDFVLGPSQIDHETLSKVHLMNLFIYSYCTSPLGLQPWCKVNLYLDMFFFQSKFFNFDGHGV